MFQNNHLEMSVYKMTMCQIEISMGQKFMLKFQMIKISNKSNNLFTLNK